MSAKLARELGLIHNHPLIGAGLPVWLPAGAAVRAAIEDYVRDLEHRAGYQRVYSPPIGKRELYELSGHWQHFADDMFPLMDDEVLRPSLCPHHALVFAARGRSYRELPVRIGEIGQMFRAERSGVVGGLNRVRCITLNDAHLFCAPDQLDAEVGAVLDLIGECYEKLGIFGYRYRLSLRGPGDKYVAGDEMWARAEGILRAALVDRGLAFEELPGEAAFYGPKIDVQVPDAAGREWTLSTVQLDFHKPERFDLEYTDSDGERRRPVMIHRSLVGSMERLLGLLLDQHDGALPAWCAPVQVAVLPVGDAPVGEFVAAARAAGLRVEVLLDGGLGARVARATADRVPYVAVIGDREAAAGAVSLRIRGASGSSVHSVCDAVSLIGHCAP
ncbi:threonine--tRNA ligase [Longispora sp. K20-0274]|uniref:threonine--tRNA ligase n=1 Tax=Longispora sp. K20-0274 TaxID=3088255 RepID=UPI00399BC06F